jgi:4-hydroxy-tetrahydrodipicolinate synthase
MSLRQQLQGTGVAMVTPFKSNTAIDFDALGKLIDFIIDNGVEYVVSLGTTGETATLDAEEKADIIHYTFEKVNNRVPVVVGVGGNNTREVMENLQSYPLEKAIAVLSASPYYNKPSQEGIFQHFKNLANASPKPILLYNVPGRTGSNMTAETTLRLANEVEGIAGIKEASGNMIQCMHILRDRPDDFLVVSGDDHLTLPLIACGMDGVISVAANSFPLQFSGMVRCCLKHDFITAKKINDNLIDAYNIMFAENNPAGVKAFLYEMGMLENIVRLPVVPLNVTLQQEVKKYLAK